MSSNETLTAPAPIIDAIDMQPASTNMAEEQGYTYQRTDGTVERAMNAEDAIARCPVLGKLAIESPDQASILLELATVGNAKMAAEAKKEPKKHTVQVQHSEPKPAEVVKVEKKITKSIPEQLTRAELPTIVKEPNEEKQPVIKIDIVSDYQAEYERVSKHQREESLHIIDNVVEQSSDGVTAISLKPKSEPPKKHTVGLKLVTLDRAEPVRPLIAHNESVDSAPIISSEIEQHHRVVTGNLEIDSEQKLLIIPEYAVASDDIAADTVEVTTPIANVVETIITEPDEQYVSTDEMVNTLDVEYVLCDTETALESADTEVPDFTLNMVSDPNAEPVSNEIIADPDEKIELLFEPETIETYFEILDLIVDSESSEVVLAEVTEPEVSVLNLFEIENESELVGISTFEAFIATQPVNEKVTLESIKEQSSEQPLEQTLVQLLECLAQSTEDDEQLEALTLIVKDIEKALPKCYVRQESEKVKLQITPEITDKVLTLLRQLGYQNPREALVNLISQFGFEFLTQSLTYLFQLTDDDNRREFLRISVPASNTDDTVLSRLSKLILELVIGKETLPDSMAA